jgi:hypothetical protein
VTIECHTLGITENVLPHLALCLTNFSFYSFSSRTYTEDEVGHELQHGNGSLGKFQTAYDGEVAAIENGLKSVVQSQVNFEHISVQSDSTSAILRAQHNTCGPGQSRATKIIRHV